VLNCPVIFFCRNNGYAISTPSKEQYHGDGIAARGYGYGIDTVRVDGNDIWAVYHAMKQAKEIALNESRPIIIEAMTYRVGHHSTSDDSTRYRTSNEVEFWKRRDNPLTRLRQYMEARGWWNADKEKEFANASRVRVLEALRNAEKHSKPAVSEMFNDVYAELPLHLQRQKQELIDHLAIYPGEYPNEEFNGF
jgi:2-oxoisovalerate dehydrogenase E1 component alpha subunit